MKPAHNPFVLIKGANIKATGSSKASKPLFLVPFARDELFINRVDIFTKINKYIDQHHRVALSGIGGIGLVILAKYYEKL